MNEGEVYGVLEDIFQDLFMRDDIRLVPGTTAADVEGWDSFRMIEIIMAVEERFRIKLPTKALDALENVGDLVRAVSAAAH